MFSPSYSEQNSHTIDVGNSPSIISRRQPIINPHQRFLTRTMKDCPSHLTGRQRTKWLTTGRKAQANRHLLATLNPFHWSETFYDPPIFIHRRTCESHLYGIIHKISNVRLYTIDTEADKPTTSRSYSLPALIQIQAIHDETYSTIILIEVQHLPPVSSSLFSLIQKLCRMIFSSSNKLLAWGNIQKELRPFKDFNLFDLSQVTNTLDLQQCFTNQWNNTHPHTPDCPARHQPWVNEPVSDNILVCLVNTDDIDDEFNPHDLTEDYNTCICPTEIRPCKAKNAVWSLQKAVEFSFSQALDKTLTLNIWSCGLDLSLHTWRSNRDKHTRQSLILYAMNDLFAPTCLYFHLNNISSPSSNSTNSIHLQSTKPNQTTDLPLILILADGHGKYFPPTTLTSSYKIIVKSISGLQWVNQHSSELCAKSIILSSSISSLLSSCAGVFFLIGTNSVRNIIASKIITQIDDFLDLIRSHHAHLKHKIDISIAFVFPCSKPCFLFESTSALLSNIQNYNFLLKDLAFRKQITLVDLHITSEQLNHDGIHVQSTYVSFLWTNIQHHCQQLILQKSTKSDPLHRRSRAAITHRNKRRHQK